MSDEHMWLIPFTDGQDHLLTVDLGQCSPLIGLRVWNYNKCTDDSFRGVRNMTVLKYTLTKLFRPPISDPRYSSLCGEGGGGGVGYKTF